MDCVPVAVLEALVPADFLVVLQSWNERAAAGVNDDPARVDQRLGRAGVHTFPDLYGLVWTQQGSDGRHVPLEPSSVIGDAPQTDIGQAGVRG
jgi:hypothetical protein